MKGHLKRFAKISAKTVVRWFSVFLPGLLLSSVFLVFSVVSLYPYVESNNTPGIALIVLSVVSVLMPFLYYSLAMKFSLSAAFYDIWNGSLREWLFTKITYYVDKAIDRKGRMAGADEYVTDKAKILQAIRSDSELSYFQKKILNYFMGKVLLEEEDFLDSERMYSDVVIERLKIIMNDLFYPSRKLTYIVYAVHILMLILAVVFHFDS